MDINEVQNSEGFQKLKHFLIREGAFDSFVNSVEKEHGEPFDLVYSRSFNNATIRTDLEKRMLSRCLSWELSEKGFDYWDNLYRQFNLEYDSIPTDDDINESIWEEDV
jgi:hypothetical protein